MAEAICQIPDKYYYKDINKELSSLDSSIRIKFSDLHSSYFVISYPICGAVTSWGNQLYATYQRIKKRNQEIVLIISNEGGIRKKDINTYLLKVLKATKEEVSKIKVIWDNDLYDEIQQGRDLVRLIYIFRNNVFYDEAQKFKSVSNVGLPKEKLSIVPNKEIALKNIDSFLIKKNDALFPYKEGHLLLLGDFTNSIFDIDLSTGNVTPLLDFTKIFKPYDIYNDFILKGKDSSKYNFAKKSNQGLLKENRQTIQVSNVKYQQNTLFGAFTIEVMEINDKEVKYLSDERETITEKIGKPTLRVFSFFFQFDPETKKIKLFHLNHPKGKDIFSGLDMGFYLNNDTLFTSVTRYPQPKIAKGHIAQYKIIKDSLIFDTFLKPDTKEDDYFAYNNIKDHFFKFNESIYYTYSCYGDIYLIDRQKQQSSFFGNGHQPYKKQSYKQYSDDQVDEKINFNIQSISTLSDDNYLLAFYKYQDEYIFELKNRMFKTIDIVSTKNNKEFQNYIQDSMLFNLLLDHNKIFYLDIVEDELVLREFEATVK